MIMTKLEVLHKLQQEAAELGIVIKEVSFMKVHESKDDEFKSIDRMLGVKIS